MKARRVADKTPYLRADGQEWAGVAHDDIALMPAPLAMQPTEYIRKSWEGKPYGTTTAIAVAAVHDGHECAIHLRWSGVSATDKDFPDAVAVAMPIHGNPALVLMGQPDAPIHILRWQANRSALRSIIATGIGQSRPGPELKCGVSAKAADGAWSVVISRPFGHGKDIAPLAAGMKTKLGFALWSGANDERAGIKAFSIDWAELALDA